jgi:hypothetical protein
MIIGAQCVKCVLLCLPAALDKLRNNLVAMKKAHSSEEDKWVVGVTCEAGLALQHPHSPC